jgi:hypothetical protein
MYIYILFIMVLGRNHLNFASILNFAPIEHSCFENVHTSINNNHTNHFVY